MSALGNVQAVPHLWPCQNCLPGVLSFLTRGEHNAHIRVVHDTKFLCREYGSVFISKTGLDDHKKAKHPAGKNSLQKYSQYGKGFAYKSKLAEHMSTHCPSVLPYPKCSKKFRDATNLQKYDKEQYQPKESLLCCPLCFYKHGLRHYVVFHMLRVHNIKAGRLFSPTTG